MWEIFSCCFFDISFIMSSSSRHSYSNGTCGYGLDQSVLLHCILGNSSSLIRLSDVCFFFSFMLLSPRSDFISPIMFFFFFTFKNAVFFFAILVFKSTSISQVFVVYVPRMPAEDWLLLFVIWRPVHKDFIRKYFLSLSSWIVCVNSDFKSSNRREKVTDKYANTVGFPSELHLSKSDMQ